MTTGDCSTSFASRLNAASQRVDNYRFVLSIIAAVVGRQARELSALRLELEGDARGGDAGQRRQLAGNAVHGQESAEAVSVPVNVLSQAAAPGD